MNKITKLRHDLAPLAIQHIRGLWLDSRQHERDCKPVVFLGLAYIVDDKGEVWHVAVLPTQTPGPNTWTDRDFGLPDSMREQAENAFADEPEEPVQWDCTGPRDPDPAPAAPTHEVYCPECPEVYYLRGTPEQCAERARYANEGRPDADAPEMFVRPIQPGAISADEATAQARAKWEAAAEPFAPFGESAISTEELIAKHGNSLKHRARIEAAICRRLLRDLRAAGYTLTEESEGDEEPTPLDDPRAALLHLFNLDDALICMHKPAERIGHLGWIMLVFGNNGYELISDYTTNFESIIAPIYKWIDEAEARGLVPAEPAAKPRTLTDADERDAGHSY